MKLLGIVTLALGLSSLAMAWALADPDYRYDRGVLGSLCALVAASLVAIHRMQTPRRVAILMMLAVSVLAEGFFRIASASPFAGAWCLVLGAIFSLVMCPLFGSVLHYLSASALVWLVLGRGQWIRISPEHDLGWSLLATAVVLAMGILLNVSFTGLRREGYRQRIRLQDMAYQDMLTRLDNRRSLMERLRTLQEADQLQYMHFLMIDIDDFKQINDRFGHDQGDAVLQALAIALRTHAAPHAAVRLGGEEFAVPMETGDRSDALALAQRLLIAAHALARHPAGAPTDPHAWLTISIGVASGRPGDLAGDLLRRSDAALYAAKQAGKDRIMADTGMVPATASGGPAPASGSGIAVA